MGHTSRLFWGIGWRTPFLVPVAAVCAGILGGVYEYLVIKNPWGIANIVAFLFAVFALGFIMYATARLSKLRNTPVAWIIGTGLGIMFLLVATVTAYYASPLGRSTGISLGGFLAKHRAAGLPMFNGGYALGGIWLLIVWILGVICIWLVPTTVACLEASRPFCEECKTWGYTPRWKFNLKAPGEEGVARLKKEQSLTATTGLRPGGKPGSRIECAVGACKCGRIASLAVGLYKSQSGTTIADEWPINDLNMTPKMLVRLFSWAESLDPGMVAKRPMLAVAELAKSPFEVEPKPADNKYRVSTRWSAPLGASDSYVDNEYTKALRKRLKNGEYELIKPALRAQRHIEDFAYVAEACADWEGQPGWLGDWEYGNSSALCNTPR